MASGDSHDIVAIDPGSLPEGAVVTNGGRVSAARTPGQSPTTPPFSRDELIGLDDALKDASEKAEVRFSVFIGDLGSDPVAGARAQLAAGPEPAHGALIAVSPNTQDIAVVSGSAVAGRVNDRVAQLGVTAAVPPLRNGHLIDGLIAALRVMATAAAKV